MKNFKRVLGILFVAGILLAAYTWFFVYNKPHRNFEKAKPDITMSARDCYNGFSQNKLHAGGKVLEIYGIPSSIESSDTMVVVVFAFPTRYVWRKRYSLYHARRQSTKSTDIGHQ